MAAGKTSEVCRVCLVTSGHVGWPGVRAILRKLRWVEVAGEASQPAAAVALVEARQPEAVIVDIRAQDGRTPALAADLHRAAPACAIIVLGAEYTPDSVAELASAGAKGLLSWDELGDHGFERQLSAVLGSRSFLAVYPASETVVQALAAGRANVAPTVTLSTDQQHVLERLVAGETIKEIAARLGMKRRSVERHVSDLKHVLATESRPELIVQAQHAHLLPKPARNRCNSMAHSRQDSGVNAPTKWRVYTYTGNLSGC